MPATAVSTAAVSTVDTAAVDTALLALPAPTDALSSDTAVHLSLVPQDGQVSCSILLFLILTELT